MIMISHEDALVIIGSVLNECFKALPFFKVREYVYLSYVHSDYNNYSQNLHIMKNLFWLR